MMDKNLETLYDSSACCKLLAMDSLVGKVGVKNTFSHQDGYQLMEVSIVIVILSLSLWVVGSLHFEGIFERQRTQEATDQIMDALTYSKYLSLSRFHTRWIEIENQNIYLHGKQISTPVIYASLPSNIKISATRWPRFTPFGFAQSGTIHIQSENLEQKIIVSSLGRIRLE